MKDSEPRGQHLSSPEKIAPTGRKGSQAIYKFATKWASSLNIKDY